MTISKGYSNVFEALEDDPTMAQNLKIRAGGNAPKVLTPEFTQDWIVVV